MLSLCKKLYLLHHVRQPLAGQISQIHPFKAVILITSLPLIMVCNGMLLSLIIDVLRSLWQTQVPDWHCLLALIAQH